VRLNSIRLQNFRQHADTSLSFENGLTGIVGANGTGKSTILEAIAWALYGTTAARGNRESIRFLRAKKGAGVRVELEFDLGAHQYRVVRSLTNAELYLDRGAAPIANSTTGVTDVLRRRLGMSREEFFNTYFTGQKELSVMAAMRPSEREEFLSQLLGYGRLDVAREIGRDRRKVVVAESAGVKSAMPDPDQVAKAASESRIQLADAARQLERTQSKSESAAAAVEKVTPQWEEAQVERDRLQRIDSDLRVVESDETSRKREIERDDRELSELGSAKTEMARLQKAIAPLASVPAELDAMNRLEREEGKRQTLARQELELAAELKTLRDRRAELETAPTLEKEVVATLERGRAALTQAEKKLDALRIEWERDKQEVNTKLESLAKSIPEYKHQRELLLKEGQSGTCPICSKPLGDHYDEVLAHIEDQLESQQNEQKYLQSRAGQLKAAPKDLVNADGKKREIADALQKLEQRYAKVQRDTQDLAKLEVDISARDARHKAIVAEVAMLPSGYVAERHAELRKKSIELQQLESRVSQLAGKVERESQLRDERDRAVTALKEIEARLKELRASRRKMAGAEARFEKVRVQYETAVAAQRTADLDLATARARHASALRAVEVAERAVADLDRAIARLEELNVERRLHEELDRAYTDLRTDLNQQLRPEISDRASQLLSELTDGRYEEFELDENYDIVLHEEGMPKQVISGGEQDLANLILRIAISEMIAERAGQPLSLLVLDEVFGSLDEFRRASVVALLRRLHERFEQVIVITHIDMERPDFEHMFEVQYDRESGASKVVRLTDGPDTLEPDQLEIGAA
jgi:DNA repair protein SbcC/Rad50